MPFTFAHPAIVLPLTYLPRKYYSTTGLVVGSMAPDFEYFIRMKILSIYSHTFEGLFIFDLPIAILISFLFHNAIKNALFDNLPNYLSSRLNHFKAFHWNHYIQKHWIIVIISILIGSISHLFWDGFTHEHGFWVKQFPFLLNTTPILNWNIVNYKLLQHSSTIIGGIVIIGAIIPLRPTTTISKINWNYWITIFIISAMILSLRILIGSLKIAQIGNIIVTIIAALFIALILTPIVLKKSIKH
jgi:Domain of unknown function (DUF4184)